MGTSALTCFFTNAQKRITGTDTNMIRNAAARPTVMGKPRSKRLTNDSRGALDGVFVAIAKPTENGTRPASASHTTRTIQLGSQWGRGMKARNSAQVLENTAPSSNTGQATAAPTNPDKRICSFGVVRPNSARTAQPKMAFRILPADLVRRPSRAWRIAMLQRKVSRLELKRSVKALTFSCCEENARLPRAGSCLTFSQR